MGAGASGRGTKKSSNMVECKKHGLYYNLNLSTGCVLCQRERNKLETGAFGRARLIVGAVALAVVGAIACLLALGNGSNDEDGAAPIISRPKAGGNASQIAKENEAKAILAIGGLLDELSRLVENAQSDMAELGENRVDLKNIDQGENRRRLIRWSLWVKNWLSDVKGVGEKNIRKKLYIPQKQSAALKSAEFAIRRMSQVPNAGPGAPLRPGDKGFKDYYLPDGSYRKAWLEEIRRLIGQAREQLEKSVS